MRNVTVAKSSPKLGATAEMFIKLPTVSNHPMGENSTNLVTLFPNSSFNAPLNSKINSRVNTTIVSYVQRQRCKNLQCHE
jgi:hypothetical protein